MHCGDKYKDFTELALNECPHHFRIEYNERDSDILILAIHGGGIERGTSELALGIADSAYRYYLFEGKKVSGNQDLHLTSIHFDEKNGLRLARHSSVTVSIHGKKGNGDCTYLGGLDHKLKQGIYHALVKRGFSAEILPENHRLAGIQVENITNQNQRGMGVQLEIDQGIRNKMFKENNQRMRKHTQTETFERYVESIREALGDGGTGPVSLFRSHW